MPEGTCAHCGAPVARKTSKYCSRSCLGLDRKKAVEVTCPCGTVFEVKLTAFKKPGEGKYCSKACMYRYRVRPTGLTYNIKVVNRGWRKPGDPPPTGCFKPGLEPWNKGIPTGITPVNAFKPSPGPRKCDLPGYGKLHGEVERARGRAAEYSCSMADTTCKGQMQWANISGEYKGVDDFMPLCQSHHFRYDGRDL